MDTQDNVPVRAITLHDAVASQDLALIKELVEAGADINATNEEGKTPLHLLSFSLDSVVQCEILRFFLERGASVECNTKTGGWTVAALILSRGTVELVKVLFKHATADVFAKEYDSMTLLHHAAQNPNPGVIEQFQGTNFNVDAPTTILRRTPLWFALMFTHANAVEFLLKNGAVANNMTDEITDLRWGLLICADAKRKWENGLKCAELLLTLGADCERTLDIYERICNLEAFVLAKPLLEHLAMREALGMTLKESSMSKINSHEKLKNYFDFCRQTIEEMKRTVVYNRITLFTFLKENENRLALYARNRNCVVKLERVLNSKRNSDSCIMKALRKNIAKALETARLREESAKIIAKFTGLGRNWDLIDMIIMYLNNQDLENVCKVLN